MNYYITETIERTYLINADSMEEAIANAFEINDTWHFEESSHGFTYIIEKETNKDKLL